MNQDVFDTQDDIYEDHSVVARHKVRQQLQQEIEEFLARGGQIQQLEPSISADPPQKPASSYYSRSI